MSKPDNRTPRAGAGNAPVDARHRILDAAQEQFAEHGFDATPTARVAAVAGVPKGLVFYYFPRKLDLLFTLLTERMPEQPFFEPADAVRKGDVAGSLLKLARRLNLGEHRSIVLRTIIHREASTHPEVRDHLSRLREHLLDLTERVLDDASPRPLDKHRRRKAAETYVAVMIAEANSCQLGAPRLDLAGAAEIVADGLLASRRSPRAPAR